MAARLRVPDELVGPFLDLIAMSSAEREELLSGLRQCGPTLIVEELGRQLGQATDLEPEAATSNAAVLVSLFLTRQTAQEPVETFVEDLIGIARELRGKKGDTRPVDWDALKRHLRGAMQMETPLGVTGKAASVAISHQRVYAASRILSDVRPVFGSDPTQPPIAGFICHNLHISYYEHGETKSAYFMLDTDDLRSLQDVLERAVDKEKSLVKVLQQAQITWLKPMG